MFLPNEKHPVVNGLIVRRSQRQMSVSWSYAPHRHNSMSNHFAIQTAVTNSNPQKGQIHEGYSQLGHVVPVRADGVSLDHLGLLLKITN